MASQSDAAGVYENRPDVGEKRENILFRFLAGHIPKRCHIIKGGYVFDALGNQSNQIDLIITNDLTLQFSEFTNETLDKSFNCIEGSYCVVSVKSMLDKQALCNAITNLASVPDNYNIKVNPAIKNVTRLLKEIPYRVVFAYKGQEIESIEKAIEEYLDNHNRSMYRFPNLIIVNNFIWTVGSEDRSIEGRPLDPSSSIVASSSRFIGGMALMHFLTKIQKVSNIGSQLLMGFEDYMSKIDVTASELDEPTIDILRNRNQK